MDASPVITCRQSIAICWRADTVSQITANGGFFLTNMFSFLHPIPFSLTTPPELGPYGWTTTDLWCAPLITGLYALLTHAQPFWADLHVLLSELLGHQGQLNYKIPNTAKPLDPELARVICAMLLAGMFATRAVKNFVISWILARAVMSILSSISSNKATWTSTQSQYSFDILLRFWES